jgi:hypothetical protein
MFKKTFYQFIFIAASAVFLLNALAAQATVILPNATGNMGDAYATKACTDYLVKHPGGNCGNYSLTDFLQLAVTVSNWILGCVGSVALLFFVFGGFTLILSGGSEEKVKQGKTILVNAVIGLALVFASYIIIQFAMTLLGVQGFTVQNPTSLNKFFSTWLKK